MSNAVSALQGAVYSGFVDVEEMGLRGMITLRGDLGLGKLAKAVKNAVGITLPDVGRCTLSSSTGAAWMSPDELLLLCPHDNASALVTKLTEHLSGEHALVANVSDARAVFQLKGEGVRDVIAKLAPIDMSAGTFPVGHFRRTRIAQTPAALFLRDDLTIELICFRSVAAYMFDLLKRASMPGSEVTNS